MKKIAKLSLVAAVAVAGLTTANAQPLEEAIKNVDVSGSVVYRYNDYANDEVAAGKDSDNANDNNYKVALNLASKVNEDVKFNSRFLVGNQENGSFVTLDSSGPDGQADVSLSNAYFGYTGLKNTTVNVGKQGLTTPWTVAVDSDGNEQTGTGILALSTVGPVTLAGAYFNQSNLDKSTDAAIATADGKAIKLYDSKTKVSQLDGQDDIATVGAIVAAGPVTLDAWYLDLSDTFDTFTVGAKSSFDVSGAKLGVDARYASLTFDGTDEDANTMAKLVLTGKAGIFDAKVAYAMTDKDGGLTALDNDATTTLLGWSLTANGKSDADYWQAVAGVDILSNLNLSANYGNLQYAAADNSDVEFEEEEVYAQLLYKMSKNLSTYVRYGTYTKENTTTNVESIDATGGRLQVAYTF
jgi:hypothetical protein